MASQPENKVDAKRENGADNAESHDLKEPWTVWFKPGSKDRRGGGDGWVLPKKVVKFYTVEDFWNAFNNILSPSQVVPKTDFYFFREGYQAAWESDNHLGGGIWEVKLNQAQRTPGAREQCRNLLDQMWLNLVMAIIGETMTHSSSVVGVAVNMRGPQTRLNLWCLDGADREKMTQVGKEFQYVMALHALPTGTFEYEELIFKPHPKTKTMGGEIITIPKKSNIIRRN